MSEVGTTSRRIVRAANSAVNAAVLVIIVALLCFSGFALWDANQVHATAAAENYAIYKPIPEEKSFDELIAINSDVCAWIEVYGTHIDYPIVQGEDNMRYLNRNAEGKSSLSGAIFLDYRNARDFSDFNSILYGHHMDKEVMFGEIGNFSEKSYFDDRRYGMLFYEGKEHGLEFFALIHADAYDGSIFNPGIDDTNEASDYLALIDEIAVQSRDIGVSADDRIVLLYTCSMSTTNGRDALVGRISDEVFDDPFASEEDHTVSVTRTFQMWWNELPAWTKAAVGASICLVALVLLLTLKKKRQSSEQKSIHGGKWA
ncbi:MAG: class B sortase [Coriobacteriia bacterium]|nr:class B sortase [Coriobacteriia bacterium]